MIFRPDYRDSEEANFWPALADVFIGFLVLLLCAAFATHLGQGIDEEGMLRPPEAREDFQQRFIELFSSQRISSNATAELDAFDEILLRFPGDFLFESCETALKREGEAIDKLQQLRDLLAEFDDMILEVCVTGHTDSERPLSSSKCVGQRIRSNWQLSALRAITVVEILAPEGDDGERVGLDPAKVWVKSGSKYHPSQTGCGSLKEANRTEEERAINRRIEILIKFRSL